MTADEYLGGILLREAVDRSMGSPVRGVAQTLAPVIQAWSAGHLNSVSPSGSFAKGTANRSGTDIDLFLSLASNTPFSLAEIYNTLFNALTKAGYTPRRQNVSINVRVGGYDVDLVPAKRQDNNSSDHSLYRRKADSWTKTNVDRHIAVVTAAGWELESRIFKLWRNQKGLDFPSFYLELTVIEALRGAGGTLSTRVWRVFEYLGESFTGARVIDPANTNNIISEDLTAVEKLAIKRAADSALAAKMWGEIVR
ncbi:nucleotidyltransferase [Mesorhizobium sp. LNHC209A00]|uniref:nucleotidyltransferase domain-containing protein n=1 Tax=Mesorhizobium TaxID=68287 RepID=UPI0003CFF32B|nr:nucleotidyltransferase [Mesorhizobium sp. LNHC209A00]ESY94639.1 hypothetical protein X738_23120 [Mesorhizobium sp. LNHC209A00]